MKTIARTLLYWIINYYPKPQLEIGRGMLAELEELQGFAALEWAFGGIQFYLELKGASMIKNIFGISSVVILAILASWLYANHQLYLSIGILVVGVIVAALSQPKQAFWCALLFAVTLPVTHLTQAYVLSSNMVHALSASITAPGLTTWVMTSDQTQEKPSYIMVDANSTVNLQIAGSLTTEATNALKAMYNPIDNMPNNLDDFLSLFENQPVKLALFGFPIAFLLAGLTLFLRSRFAKSSPLAM